MRLEIAHNLLKEAGCGVGPEYQLDVMSRNKEKELDCCEINDRVYLVMTYDISTQIIEALTLYMYPIHFSHKDQIEKEKIVALHLRDRSRFAVEIQTEK